MLDAAYLAALIRVVLDGAPFPDLDRAVPLLLGTAAQESALQHVRQVGGGPARGYFQLEPATERDHWRWLFGKPYMRAAILERSGVSDASAVHLEANIPYQILLARVHYYCRDPDRLPEPQDLLAQAHRWKQYYNTAAGAGTVVQYCATFRTLIAPYVTVGG